VSAAEAMLLPELRRQVLEANLELVRRGLVLFTFGNASGISREKGLVVIKPSGVPYERMKPGDLVVTGLNGKIVEGKLRPSSDLPTHLILYKAFPGIGGVSHTHSEYATAWAQARRAIPCFGTTHADTFHGPIPVTTDLKDAEIADDYEANTGHAIVRTFRCRLRGDPRRAGGESCSLRLGTRCDDVRAQRRGSGICGAPGLFYFGHQCTSGRDRAFAPRQTFSEKARQGRLLRAA